MRLYPKSMRRAVVLGGVLAVGSLAAFNTFSGNPRWPLSGSFHYVADLNTTSFPASSVWDNAAQWALSDWRDMGGTGFLPGFIACAAMMGLCYYYARKFNLPVERKFSVREVGR